MRRFLPIYLALLFAGSAISQNLNVAEHESIDNTGEMVSINSKVFYLESSQGGCCGSNMALVGVKDSGKVLFKTSLGILPINHFGRLIKTRDKALFLNGSSTKACDLMPSRDFIAKVDTNGVVLFITSDQLPTGFNFHPILTGITEHNDSSFYMVSSTELYHYSSTGQYLSKINTGLTGISSILALANGDLLLNGILGGTRQNVTMSTTGTMLLQLACPDIITKFAETPNYIIAKTTNGSLQTYSSTLILLASSTVGLNPANYSITDFTQRNDSIFAAGYAGAGTTPFYAILNSAFSVLYQTQASYKGITPTGIALNNKNAVHMITTCSSPVSPQYSFKGLYKLNLTGSFHPGSDIGITGISNLNTKLLGNSTGSSILTPYLTADVTVKNYGTDTVKSFYINYYAYVNSAISQCYVLLHKHINTTLLPGGSVSVGTGEFYGQPFYINPPGSTVNQKKLNICLFTTVPNEKNDIEVNNDAFCDSVLFTITGINENSLLAESVTLFPNPFNDAFQLRSGIEMSQIKLFNSLGELIKSDSVNKKEGEIICKDLSPGVYFIKIETEKGTVIKKILKN